MTDIELKPLFSQPFLSDFLLAQELLPFSDEELNQFDVDLSKYEQLFLDPEVEKNLISKNELLVSFALSKAENSELTIKEAEDVYSFLLSNDDYTLISDKLKQGKVLKKKDYEQLEFYNIAKVFRAYNQNPVTIDDLTPEYILDLHAQLTQGLDIFKGYLRDFDVYKSGQWRDTDSIRVGTYTPAPSSEVVSSVRELISWIKRNKTVTSIGIFHTSFYAIHPFCNGNKRVARVLEHIFLRSIGINRKNLYSTSYYYHKEKARYYKYLLYSLERKNLNHFVSFFQESFVISIASVIKTSLETKRDEFIETIVEMQQKEVLKPLVKRRELQFKSLFKHSKKKMARQTFVNYLQKCTDEGLVVRRESGRTTFYSLNTSFQEEKALRDLLDSIQKKLKYVPHSLSSA